MAQEFVSAIMRTEYPALRPSTAIRRATALLVEAGAAAAPVIDDDGQLVGILTQKDCFRPALHASYYQEWKGSVGDHMSRRVVTVDLQDGLIEAAEMFLNHPHRAFPVSNGTRVVGVVHRSDVLARLTALG